MLAYSINTKRQIYWKKSKSGCSLKEYVRIEKSKLDSSKLLPGESRKDFKERQFRRLKTIGAR